MNDSIPNKTGQKHEIKRNSDGTFMKGYSANPSGCPKGTKHITTLIKEALKETAQTKDGKDITIEKALIKKIIEKAIIEGDTKIIRLIWNYIDGMPQQNIDLTNWGQNIIENINYIVPNKKKDN